MPAARKAKAKAEVVDLPTPQIAAARLARVIADASICAGNDDTLPTINAVRLEAQDGTLTAVGTDRYTLAVATTPYAGPDFTALLRLADAKELVALLRSRAGKVKFGIESDFPVVDITTTPESGRDQGTFTAAFDNLNVTYKQVGGDFPKYRTLLDGGLQSTEAIAFNPAYLARFAKVQRGSTPMRLELRGQDKAAVVRIGDYFTGLIMPVRLAATERSEDVA